MRSDPERGEDAVPGDGAPLVAIVVFGGEAPSPRALADLDPTDRVIVVAADSGAHHAHALGLRVDVLVGDLDSIDPALVAELERAGIDIERHPVDKDATDLELALDVARSRGAHGVIVVGGHGGRVDQSLANALLLASPRFADLRVEARLAEAIVQVVHGGNSVTVVGRPGDTVSLLPVHGDAHGIVTTGLRFALCDESLGPGTSRGISNELADISATVRVGEGTLLVVRPGAEGIRQWQ